jgi:hypothetical protein
MTKIDVPTNRYGPSRVGANTAETVLVQSNVNVNGFGKIFSRGVDGQIYVQPLIVSVMRFPVVSPDGVNWTEVGSTTFAMVPTALAGMPVTAHMAGNSNPLLQDLCVAVIDKVNLSP